MSPRAKIKTDFDPEVSKDTTNFHDDALRFVLAHNLRRLLEEHNIPQLRLHRAIEASAIEKARISSRMLKSYVTLSDVKSSTNPSIGTLQEIARGLRYLGVDVTESHLLSRDNFSVVQQREGKASGNPADLKTHLIGLFDTLSTLKSLNCLSVQHSNDRAFNAIAMEAASNYLKSVWPPEFMVDGLAIMMEIINEKGEPLEG